jgi:ribonuclease P protein component
MRISQENENSPRAEDHQPQTPPRPQKAKRLTLCFPKSARILSKKHYYGVFRGGRKFMGAQVAMDYRLGRALCPKLGITVSRKCGKAHLRNRFKRVVREAFREYYNRLPRDMEINVIPRAPIQKITKHVITADLDLLLSIIKNV